MEMEIDALHIIKPQSWDASWWRYPGALPSRECETPQLIMGTSKFDADGEHKHDYCKLRFSEGVVTDVWEIIKRKTDSEEKECSSAGLSYELQVLLYSQWVLNPVNDVIMSTLIYFENLQNINVCLRPGKINGYTEAPGRASLLKMSEKVVKTIVPDPALIPHSLVEPTHPLWSQLRTSVAEYRHGKDSFVLILIRIFPCRLSLFPYVKIWVQLACPCLSVDWGHHFSELFLNPFELHAVIGGASLWGKYVYPMDYYWRGGGKWTNYHIKIQGRKIVLS